MTLRVTSLLVVQQTLQFYTSSMTVKKAVKKVVDKVKSVVTPKEVTPKVVKTETTPKCHNCSSHGEQCYICTPVFEDTFGK